ncbi:MAG: hypothetical protein AAGJ87_12810 [Pseudomonadota bacterium]
MNRIHVAIAAAFAVFAAPIVGAVENATPPLEGETLYRVTTVRAAPGKLEDLINWTRAMLESDFYKDAGVEAPMIMRHSQGDQWDLMKVTPMGSWEDYYARRASRKRAAAEETHAEKIRSANALVAFAEDHFAYGPPVEDVRRAYDATGFYHIEMFEAAPGKAAALMEQRRMENAYLTATGQTANMIFRRAAGSDVDVFTIGFHADLQAFAAPSPATAEEPEAAAKAAGFKDRADISFFLRSLITGHHDTLAVKAN